MSNIEEDSKINFADLEKINEKRIFFIVDEAHRSTFGDMMKTIKQTFKRAMFFGFTGTPIHEENQKKLSTTSDVFGDELHRYSIADGIRDKNVLGFDIYKVLTFRDKDLREAVALDKAKAFTVKEALDDDKKADVFNRFNSLPMSGTTDEQGKYTKGIEDYIHKSQYEQENHKLKVIEDIKDQWVALSQNGKFHAMLATASIQEAIEYYELFKEKAPQLKVTALFDENIGNESDFKFKQDGLVSVLTDYNERYGMEFELSTFSQFKKDVANRLAHKRPYHLIERTPEEQLDLLIVVNQMLTGYDSKWINTLYLDRTMEYENLIQAFSRTNRLFGREKPFGVIRYYRFPHTMEKRIEAAVKLYSGDKPVALFVEQLDKNLKKINRAFKDIRDLFKNADVEDFTDLPVEQADIGQFAKLFNELNTHLEAARVQGFTWDKEVYEFTTSDSDQDGEETTTYISLDFDENTYRTSTTLAG